MRIRVLRGWGNVVIWAERVSRVGRVSTGCLLLSLVCSPINFPVGTTGYLASLYYKNQRKNGVFRDFCGIG